MSALSCWYARSSTSCARRSRRPLWSTDGRRPGRSWRLPRSAPGWGWGRCPSTRSPHAGFALRHAALREAETRQARADLIAAARTEGAEWVALHETGDPLAGFADPYGSIRVHLLRVGDREAGVQPDPATGAVAHTLTVVGLDPLNGDLVDDDPGIADLTYSDCTSFRSGEVALRGLVEEVAAQGSCRIMDDCVVYEVW